MSAMRRVLCLIGDDGRAAVAHITTGPPQIVRRLLPELNRAGIVFVPVTEFLRERARL